jgi:xanthine dehydrogenase YagS FAD-binding subunit
MHPTTYSRATDSAVAISGIASSEHAKFLGGGTTLVDLMKLDVEKPRTLVDVSRLETKSIRAVEGGLEIGAAATNTAVANDAMVKQKFPVLSQAILSGATQQIRNMATVGGNLLQRVRCPYFRDGISPCNKRSPGSGCSAKGGLETSLAVLGTSDACYATHPSDMAVALVALDAVVRVEGPKGKREIAIESFHTLPGETPHIETTLARDELITSVFVPDSPRGAKSLYLKMRDRASYEFALASCAAAIELNGERVTSARLALGGVGTKPWRVRDAENILQSGTLGDELYKSVSEAALKDAKPLPGNAFKIELAKRVIVKTLKSLLQP